MTQTNAMHMINNNEARPNDSYQRHFASFGAERGAYYGLRWRKINTSGTNCGHVGPTRVETVLGRTKREIDFQLLLRVLLKIFPLDALAFSSPSHATNPGYNATAVWFGQSTSRTHAWIGIVEFGQTTNH